MVLHNNNHLHNHQQQQQLRVRDLTVEEQRMLGVIRRRKAELLSEIGKLQEEIEHVTRELSASSSSTNGLVDSSSIGCSRTNLLLPHGGAPPSAAAALVVVPLAEMEADHAANTTDSSFHHHHPHLQQQPHPPAASASAALSASTAAMMKVMSLGCKKFNMDPKKGIEFLVANNLLSTATPTDVAQFLYRGEGLNKTAIGDYLGEKVEFNEAVLKAFVDLHDFTNLLLVQALRQFLWSFRLPGEAQKIDRMMECFARRYCQLNPDIFTNTDTCYVLSFAIIMLNTSLHNPSVKEKPGLDQFVSMNRGIDNGGDLNRDLLESLYASIQAEPFKIPEDDGNDLMHTFFNPDKEGWLWKQGGRYKTWKRRWFILNDNCLYYFEFTTDKEPRGIIPLENVGVREVNSSSDSKKSSSSSSKKDHQKSNTTFEIFAKDNSGHSSSSGTGKGGTGVIKACKTDSDGRVVEGKHSVYRMMANDPEEKTNWVRALSKSISYSPFYELLGGSGGNGGSGRLPAPAAAATEMKNSGC